MRNRKILIRSMVGMLVLGTATAFAQEGATPAEPATPADQPGNPEGGEPPAAEPATPAEPPANDTSDIPPPSDTTGIDENESNAEKITTPQGQWGAEAEGTISEMRNMLTKSLGDLAKARKDNDAVRVNCLNEKITAMKGVLKIADNGYIALQEHLANSDEASARYQFQKIRIANRKMRKLNEEAENCVGAEASWTGGTDVKVAIDDDLVGRDDYYRPDSNFFDPGGTEFTGGSNTIGGDDPVEVRPPVASISQ